MPTAHSSAEPTDRWAGRWRCGWSEPRRAAADLTPILAFRAAAVRGRGKHFARGALALLAALTVAAAWLPGHLSGTNGIPLDPARAATLLPGAYLGVLLVSVVSAAFSGGGRELLTRDHGVAFPVSPTTDHLGALLMAPLNITWLLQSWTVLAATAYAVGPRGLLAAQVPVLLWIAMATALAQFVAWGIEWVRRGPGGAWLVRGGGLLFLAAGVVLVGRGSVAGLAAAAPTDLVLTGARAGAGGAWLQWSLVVLLLAAGTAAAVVAGATLAHALVRRPARDEARLESAAYARRGAPTSDVLAMLRVDRAGVWRAVPLRRGITVLAVLPGLVAVATSLAWPMLPILPGLVTSGAALLFGVNAWSLDSRGALWRESLPVRPRAGFAIRVLVLAEVLLLATGTTVLLAAVRAGAPTAPELAAVACATAVVTLQVLSGALRWSVRRPFAVDLRSARATPAPPLTMVGYSTRLALVTTFTGLLFTSTASAGSWRASVLLAVPFVVFSLVRLARTARSWDDPGVRSRVATTVAG